MEYVTPAPWLVCVMDCSVSYGLVVCVLVCSCVLWIVSVCSCVIVWQCVLWFSSVRYGLVVCVMV